MKTTITFLFCLLTSVVFAQKTDSLGMDNNLMLNNQEAIQLDSFIRNFDFRNKNMFRADFRFENKKVIFTTGTKGTKISRKSDFFKYYSKWKLNGEWPVDLYLIEQNENYKTAFKGYDVILIYGWEKTFIDPQKVIENVNKKVNEK